MTTEAIAELRREVDELLKERPDVNRVMVDMVFLYQHRLAQFSERLERIDDFLRFLKVEMRAREHANHFTLDEDGCRLVRLYSMQDGFKRPPPWVCTLAWPAYCSPRKKGGRKCKYNDGYRKKNRVQFVRCTRKVMG